MGYGAIGQVLGEKWLGVPYWSGAQHKPLDIQTFHQDFHATIHLANNVFLGHKDVVKDEFAGVGAAHAKFIEFACAGETLGCGGDDEGCDAFGAFIGFSLGVDNYGVCVWPLFPSV